MSRTEAVRWRGAARRVLTVLAVLVAALPSAAAGAAAASPPPPADMGLLVARLGRLEAAVREQARETREARADAWALERRVAELEAEREDASTRRRAQHRQVLSHCGRLVHVLFDP
jgi:Spy/CpxP family protein refolding chaperone